MKKCKEVFVEVIAWIVTIAIFIFIIKILNP
jgi:hypothetical protein